MLPLPVGIPLWGTLVKSFTGEARHPSLAGLTLLHVLDDPEGLPGCPSAHGDVVLRGSAGGEGVHGRGVAQSLVLRNCKRPVRVKCVPAGRTAKLTCAVPKCSVAWRALSGALGGCPSTRCSKVTLDRGCRVFPTPTPQSENSKAIVSSKNQWKSLYYKVKLKTLEALSMPGRLREKDMWLFSGP